MISLLQSGYTTVQVSYNKGVLPVPKVPVMILESNPRGLRDHFMGRALRMQAGEVTPPWHDVDAAKLSDTKREKTYTYKAPLDMNLQPGDTVVVDSKISGVTLATVQHIDHTPQIDVDADFDYKWVIQKVDFEPYNARLDEELRFNDTLREVERVKQREELVKTMSAHLPEGTEARALFDAAVARVSGAQQISMTAGVTVQTSAPPTGQIQEEGMQCK